MMVGRVNFQFSMRFKMYGGSGVCIPSTYEVLPLFEVNIRVVKQNNLLLLKSRLLIWSVSYTEVSTILNK